MANPLNIGGFQSGENQQPAKTEHISNSRIGKGERGIWQRRYWEHAIRDERDFQNHVDYIHYNPVKHGLVTHVKDWPHSTFHRWVKAGHYDENWAAPPAAMAHDGIYQILD